MKPFAEAERRRMEPCITQHPVGSPGPTVTPPLTIRSSLASVIWPSVDSVNTAHDLSSQRQGKRINKLIYDPSLRRTMKAPSVLSNSQHLISQ